MAVDLTVVLDVYLWVLLDAEQFRIAFVEPPPGPSWFPSVTFGIFWCICRPCGASCHGLSLYSDKGSSSMEKLLAGQKKKKQTVKHQGGDNAALQHGRARGQSHDEKWPGTNAFGLKKNKFPYLLNSGERPIVLGSLPAPLHSLELRTFTKYKELLIMFCLVGTYMINSMQALLVQ